MKNNNNLIWIDLEMTGLDVNKECIIEIATIVTDEQLNILAEGPSLAIHQDDNLLENMDEWNTKQHNKSGLVERVRASELNESVAENMTIEFLKNYIDAGQSPMCGNSVHQDRFFLRRYMPALEAYFHYRNIDVSTFKELAKRWAPEVYAKIEKESKHLALDDIKESIDELQYYRNNLLKS